MSKKILGVTGCPTGIAHTYMAAEALKKAAEARGCEIKIETNGAVGAENELTPEDIAGADAIIVACDKKTDMNRFNGKPVIEVSVTDGINKADHLVNRAINGDVPIRSGAAVRKTVNNDEDKQSVWHQIYKHLMNGVSHMLPLVVAGGVLTAISFLWGIYSYDVTSDQYNAFAAMLKTIGGYSMNLMVPVLTAFIAQSISDRPGMLAGFVAGMIAIGTGSGFIGGIIGGFFAGYFVLYLVRSMRKMPRQLEGFKSIFLIPIISVFVVGVFMVLIGVPCTVINENLMSFLTGLQDSNPILLGIVIGCMCAFDMGGPVNKAAYVTGTLLLGEGNYYFMAGVSAACITPPLVIAIAATIKKNRFTEDDRAAAYVNYILGSTHITEGAIPFAAKNPFKVLPVLMISSSISAVLTYMFKIQVPAPHGGFLILPLVSNPFLWVLCILIGSVIGALLYIMVTPVATEEDEELETAEEMPVPADDVEKVQTILNETNNGAVKSDRTDNQTMSLFRPAAVKMNVKGRTKDDVIEEMTEVLINDGDIADKKAFKKAIYDREEIASTGIGMGIAIPHAKTGAVSRPTVAVGLSKEGFDFAADDGSRAHMIFMIATNNEDGDLHLNTLAELSRKLMDDDFKQAIEDSRTAEEVAELLNRKS